LRVLYLEDEPKDVELVKASLEEEGIFCDLTRADTQADFVAFLEQGGFDLILADYTLPSFDGISALKIAKEVRPEVPFIFVSGTLVEEIGIEALKQGATDYISKTRLSRIVPSVRRALREAEERSQRKRAEEALLRNEAYLAEAQKLSHTGSFGWYPSSGEIYWSEETYRIFGLEQDSQLTLERIMERIHPEDRARVQEILDEAPREGKEFDYEHRLLMADGSVKYVNVVGHPSTRGESDDLEFLGAITDITDRKWAEKELQQIVDFVPQYLVVLDPEGRTIHANQFAWEYLGRTLDELRSLDLIGKYIHPNDVERMRTARARGLSGSAPFELEARFLGKDGVYRWFLFRYNPLVEQSRVKRWYASGTEIESRKQEEERVRKENIRLEERTRIAQELHDTLLQSFLSASLQVNVASDDLPADSPVKPRLDRILELMNQGTDEARRAIQDLRTQDSRSSDLVVALSGIRQEFAVPPGVDFRVAVTGQQQTLPPFIHQEVYRIGREALVNAFRHSGAKRIDFEIEYTDRDLRLTVRDNGCGIDPQVLRDGREGHWGLAGMRERATRIGGLLKISSNATAGTEIQMCVPGKVAFQISSTDYSS